MIPNCIQLSANFDLEIFAIAGFSYSTASRLLPAWYYTKQVTNEVCTNQGFKSVVPFIIEMNEYIYYFLMAQLEDIRMRASGTTFKEISSTEMGNTIFILLPLAEQQRIVAAIEAAFEQLDRIAESLK